MWRSIRRRIGSSGSGPRIVIWVSLIWSGFDVPQSTQVAAGWAMTRFSKNCAQLLAPKSCAKSGRGSSATTCIRRAFSSGRLTKTPMPRSAAAGSSLSSAERLKIEWLVCTTSTAPRSMKPVSSA